MAGIGCGCDGLAYAVEGDLAAKIGVTEAQVQELSIGLIERLTELDQLLNETLPA